MRHSEIQDAIQRHVPYYTTVLADLVRLDSRFGQEDLVQMRVLSEMQRLGLDVEIIHSRADERSINLATRIAGKDSDRHRSLVLNAHADIAPVDMPEAWSHPPFGAEIAEGRLYGRGSQDDKAGIATILLALAAIRDLDLHFGGDLTVHSVIEEETTGNGTRAVLARGYDGDGVIICDGTWPERVIYAHLGQVSFKVKVAGQAMAASNVGRTSSPFDRAATFVGALKERVGIMHSGTGPFEGIDPPYFVNVGAVHGGVWSGAVPAAMTMDIQIGFAPPFTAERIEAEVVGLANTVPDLTADPWVLRREPFRTDPANRMISEVAKAVRRNRGREIKTQAVGGYTDMSCFFTNDICLHGPGSGGNAHGTDEFYVLNDMSDVAHDLISVALSWCWQTKK